MSKKAKIITASCVAGVLVVAAVLGGWWLWVSLYAGRVAEKFKSTAFAPAFEQVAPASLSAEIGEVNSAPPSAGSSAVRQLSALGINTDSLMAAGSEQDQAWDALIEEFDAMHQNLNQYKGWILESFTNSGVSQANTWVRLNHSGGGYGYYKYEDINGNTAIYEQKVSANVDNDGTTVYKGKLYIGSDGTTEMYVNSLTTYDADPDSPLIIRAYSRFSEEEFTYIAYWEASPSDINVIYMSYQFDENAAREGICVNFIIDDGTYSSISTSLFWGDEENLFLEYNISDEDGPISQFYKLEQKGTAPAIYTDGNFWESFRMDIPVLSTIEISYANREEIAERLKTYCLTFEVGFRDE